MASTVSRDLVSQRRGFVSETCLLPSSLDKITPDRTPSPATSLSTTKLNLFVEYFDDNCPHGAIGLECSAHSAMDAKALLDPGGDILDTSSTPKTIDLGTHDRHPRRHRTPNVRQAKNKDKYDKTAHRY